MCDPVRVMTMNPKAFAALGTGGTVLLISLLALPTPEIAVAQSFEKVGPATMAQVGKQLFSDTSLSEPAGMACITCHSPSAGFSSPVSRINADMGVVPGVMPGRFGFRKVPTVSYTPFMPIGPPHLDKKAAAYVGGMFYDGRAKDVVEQAKMPLVDPNEMNNLLHNLPSPDMVVAKLAKSPTSVLFKKVFGNKVFERPTAEVMDMMARAIAAYEASPDVSPFNSKYDAVLEGRATFTPQELTGMRIATGRLNGRPDGLPFPLNAHCMDCHGISDDLSVRKDIWTKSCYANLGAPRNYQNPFYQMTDPSINPVGWNPLGADFVDFGLGDFIYPMLGKPAGNLAEGDPLNINGLFKAPTLRNLDKRPYPGFVKSYFHNGVFKSLKEVVHFYNTRNLTTFPGEVIDFTKPDPYAGLIGTPLWAKPEIMDPDTLNNPLGNAGGEDEGQGQGSMFEAEIGNLNMTEAHEDAIVAFLQTLSDGYFQR